MELFGSKRLGLSKHLKGVTHIVRRWLSFALILFIFAFPVLCYAEEDSGLKIEFIPKKKDGDKPTGGSIIEGPEIGQSAEPLKPDALEPLTGPDTIEEPTSEPVDTSRPGAISAPPPPIPSTAPKPAPDRGMEESIRSERLIPASPSTPAPPPVVQKPSTRLSDLQMEFQPAGGTYTQRVMTEGTLQPGERLRWKYPKDTDWRVLEAYNPTNIKLMPSHYEVSGGFFHSFKDGTNRVQVPTLREGKDRRDRPDLIGSERTNMRLFVEVDPSAPKAPAPQGNCVVWQKGKLWLNDLAGGEVDSLVDGKMVDHLEVTALIPGLIFILTPPSQIKVYAVKVNFEAEIFKLIGREKGRSDRQIQELARLLQMADTPEKQTWCESRMAYEQEQSRLQSDKQTLYQMFLRNELDAWGLVRSGQPLPHIQMAQTVYRHENIELSVGLYSDHLGKSLLSTNAFLWINESMPTPGTPFNLEIIDQSDPSFLGFDTRFRAEGERLIAEERFKGSAAWVPRSVVVDLYYYATFRPPQPQGQPGYLVDVTMDLTGGLKRLNKEQATMARLGTIQLTPDLFRIDLSPALLLSSGPMEKIVRDIILQPFDLRGWYTGRRSRIHEVFEHAPLLPDEILNEIENAADELGVRVYEAEKPKRTAIPSYLFDPQRLSISLSRTTTPGELRLDIELENVDKEIVRVTRGLFPKVDVLDFAARSVASNRGYVRLEDFRPLTLGEWIEARQPRTLLSN